LTLYIVGIAWEGMNSTIRNQWGGLEVISTNNIAKQHVFLIHGYGANAQDLFPLAKYLDEHGQYQWHFPQAPIELESYPNFTARAWFNIDNSLPMPRQYQNLTPKGFHEAANLLTEAILASAIDSSQIVLGGFSQGAMMAIEVVLRAQLQFKGAVLLSTTLINQQRWQRKIDTFPYELNLYQSHGKQDPLLSFENAQALYNMLSSNEKISVNFTSFNGGHEIPQIILQELHEFLL